MTEFTGEDLSGSRLERVDLTDAEFRTVHLPQARLQGVDLTGAVIRPQRGVASPAVRRARPRRPRGRDKPPSRPLGRLIDG